jgi:thiamine-monophosphate kinase
MAPLFLRREISPVEQEAPITVGELGEFSLISAIAELLPRHPALLLGAGDDAAVISAPDRRVVATTDLLVEGRHFRRDWSGPGDVGVKAAAQNLADVAAMGAAPTALLVGIATPADLPVAWALDLVRGLVTEAQRAGASVAGGDITSSDTLMLAVTALGDLAGRAPVTRSGARPGDLVAVAGRLGWSAAGLALLQAGGPDGPGIGSAGPDSGSAGPEIGSAGPESGSAGPESGPSDAGPPGHDAPWLGEDTGWLAELAPGCGVAAELGPLVTAHRRPQPPYPAGPEAARLGATAMIDISDGLVQDLGHVAEASGVGMDIASAALPASSSLLAAGRVLAVDWRDWALTGGEDHALAATFPADIELPDGWVRIGAVTAGSGVLVDSRPRPGRGGWDHFRSPGQAGR